MFGPRISLKMLAVCLVGTLAVLPAAAQAPELGMLAGLQKGTWAVRDRSGGNTMQVCVRTGQELIQLRHRQASCERFVVQDDANEVTVQYTCRGNGYGRTSIRKESATLVQVRSQGIQGSTPFSIEGEARRTGGC
jgi:hypothetical protein